MAMPDKKKPLHPETNFLPPLDMILSFFKKEKPSAETQPAAQEKTEVKGQDVKRLIEHITQQTEEPTDQKKED